MCVVVCVYVFVETCAYVCMSLCMRPCHRHIHTDACLPTYIPTYIYADQRLGSRKLQRSQQRNETKAEGCGISSPESGPLCTFAQTHCNSAIQAQATPPPLSPKPQKLNPAAPNTRPRTLESGAMRLSVGASPHSFLAFQVTLGSAKGGLREWMVGCAFDTSRQPPQTLEPPQE